MEKPRPENLYPKIAVVKTEMSHLHCRFAFWAGKLWSLPLFRLYPDEDMQYQLDECPDLTGVAMEETIIANVPEALWQQMFDDKVEENLPFYGSIAKLT